ncbi:MAG: APC family permease [Planctomycetes bacterium]|nr:APC family permease [Planctomycetota bacterium]
MTAPLPSAPSAPVRGIRRWDLVALFLNGIIGAGIFGLPSRVHALVGAYGLFAYALCALVVLGIVLAFAEAGSRFDKSGGPGLYAREAFGPWVGSSVSWLVWLSRVTAFAALANLFADYLAHVFPEAKEGGARAAVITVLVLALAAVNLVGVRRAALVGDVFTVAKLVPLLAFVVLGLAHVEGARFDFSTPPNVESISQAVLLLVFAFTGFESAVIPAGEVVDPRRNLPFAALTSLAIVAPLYLAVQFVCIGTHEGLAASTRPLAEAAERFLGPAGGVFIAVGALVSISGTLNGITLATPRMLFALGEQGELPRAFAATHARFHTPHVAILATTAAVLALSLSGSFLGAVSMSTLARLVTYAATCAAVPVLRRRAGEDGARFRVPGGTITIAGALLAIAWLFTSVAGVEFRNVGIVVGLGILVRLAMTWSRARSTTR